MNFKERRLKKKKLKKIELLEAKIVNILNRLRYYNVEVDIENGIISCRFDGDLNSPKLRKVDKNIIFNTISLDTLKEYLTEEEKSLLSNVKNITYEFYGNNSELKFKNQNNLNNNVYIRGNGNIKLVGNFDSVKSLKIDSTEVEFLDAYISSTNSISINSNKIKLSDSYLKSNQDFIIVSDDAFIDKTKLLSDEYIVIKAKNNIVIEGNCGIKNSIVSKSLFLDSNKIKTNFLNQFSTDICVIDSNSIDLSNTNLSSRTINFKADNIYSFNNLIYGEEKVIIKNLNENPIYRVVSPFIMYNGNDISNKDKYEKIRLFERLKKALLTDTKEPIESNKKLIKR